MYIPAFLPCPKCHTGPEMQRDGVGRPPYAYCKCGEMDIVAIDYGDEWDIGTVEIQNLNILWNLVVLELQKLIDDKEKKNESKT